MQTFAPANLKCVFRQPQIQPATVTNFAWPCGLGKEWRGKEGGKEGRREGGKEDIHEESLLI